MKMVVVDLNQQEQFLNDLLSSEFELPKSAISAKFDVSRPAGSITSDFVI